MDGAVGDDLLGQRRSQPRYVGEDVFRGRVDVDPDAVDAAFDDDLQSVAEFRLVDAVLILSHADRLGIDLDQLRQRVDQPSSDADGAAHRDVLIRELLAGRGRSGVDRGAVLAHGEDLNPFDPEFAHQLERFAAGRSVAHGEGLRVVASGQSAERRGGLFAAVLRRMGEDCRVVEQVALRVENDHLAAGAETRIEGDHALLPQGRSQQQLAQILGEDPDCLVVGTLLGRGELFGLERGADQPLERIGDGRLHPSAGG